MAKEFGQLRHDFLPDCLVSLDEFLPAGDAGRRIVGEIAGKLLQAALKAACDAHPLHLFLDAVNFVRSQLEDFLRSQGRRGLGSDRLLVPGVSIRQIREAVGPSGFGKVLLLDEVAQLTVRRDDPLLDGLRIGGVSRALSDSLKSCGICRIG